MGQTIKKKNWVGGEGDRRIHKLTLIEHVSPFLKSLSELRAQEKDLEHSC